MRLCDVLCAIARAPSKPFSGIINQRICMRCPRKLAIADCGLFARAGRAASSSAVLLHARIQYACATSAVSIASALIELCLSGVDARGAHEGQRQRVVFRSTRGACDRRRAVAKHLSSSSRAPSDPRCPHVMLPASPCITHVPTCCNNMCCLATTCRVFLHPPPAHAWYAGRFISVLQACCKRAATSCTTSRGEPPTHVLHGRPQPRPTRLASPAPCAWWGLGWLGTSAGTLVGGPGGVLDYGKGVGAALCRPECAIVCACRGQFIGIAAATDAGVLFLELWLARAETAVP